MDWLGPVCTRPAPREHRRLPPASDFNETGPKTGSAVQRIQDLGKLMGGGGGGVDMC